MKRHGSNDVTFKDVLFGFTKFATLKSDINTHMSTVSFHSLVSTYQENGKLLAPWRKKKG